MDFMGNDTGKQCYSDSAKEIKNAVEACGMLNPTGTPHRPTSRGRIEVNVKASIEGARANLYQSGLEHKWWPQAIKHWNTVTNVNRRSIFTHDTPWERRTGTPFKGKILPFGAKIAYRLPGDLKKENLKFERPTRDALFLGWYVAPGAKFHGDYFVLDMEVLLEFPGQAAPRRVKEIYDPYSRSFPMADARNHALKLKGEKAACQKEGIYDIDE